MIQPWTKEDHLNSNPRAEPVGGSRAPQAQAGAGWDNVEPRARFPFCVLRAAVAGGDERGLLGRGGRDRGWAWMDNPGLRLFGAGSTATAD